MLPFSMDKLLFVLTEYTHEQVHDYGEQQHLKEPSDLCERDPVTSTLHTVRRVGSARLSALTGECVAAIV
jgi:hypothetical protein